MIISKSNLRLALLAGGLGIITTLASGLVSNGSQGGMLGANNFGYPWFWRTSVIQITEQFSIKADNLIADMAFWFMAIFFLLLFIQRFALHQKDNLLNNKKFILTAVLLVPMGFIIGLVHEIGHAVAGTLLGGTLAQLQIGYFILHPNITITTQFQLGATTVNGLTNPTSQGIFLLAGSLTTTIVSTIIALFLHTKKKENRTTLALRTLGIVGLLDLPLYTIVSALGLRHWILFGGTQPEPLIAARKLGIPDPILYLAVVVTALTLIALYSKTARMRIKQKISSTTQSLKKSTKNPQKESKITTKEV